MKNEKLELKISSENAEHLIKIGNSLRGQISWNKNLKDNIKKLKKANKKRWKTINKN